MKLLVTLGVLAFQAAGAQQVQPAKMAKLGTVDVRFQSYNVEMVEVTGGRFWKPYSSAAGPAPAVAGSTPGGLDPSLFEYRGPIDLANPGLRKLAAALGPAYMRVSGTWANTTFFQDADGPAPAQPPAGFGGVLTRAEWKGVVDFARAVDAKIVTSFAASGGTRDSAGVWTPVEAKKFLAYNRSISAPIAAAEFTNEPTFPSAAGVPAGYDGAAYGRDWAVFKPFFRQAAPGVILLGPGSVGEGFEMLPSGQLLATDKLLAASGPDPMDVFSYHFYGTVSSRCAALGAGGTSADKALSEEWLGRTDKVEAFYAKLRDQYAPGKPMWVTETGQTACGGDKWASTFADTFRYVDQMGRLAKLGVQVIIHNTLAASDYALIGSADGGKTMTPRPDYWAALLWHDTVGTTVLDAGAPPAAAVHLYAQCMKGPQGGVTLVALNLDRAAGARLEVPESSVRYTLTSRDMLGSDVELNGNPLRVMIDGYVPRLVGAKTAKGMVELPPASITFLTVAGANNPACR